MLRFNSWFLKIVKLLIWSGVSFGAMTMGSGVAVGQRVANDPGSYCENLQQFEYSNILTYRTGLFIGCLLK